jgi:hypothetical protein
MAGRSRKALGISVGARSVVVAETHIGGGRREVRRCAEYVFADGQSWDDPVALGRAFAHFLRHEKFSARQTVFGLPADWLMAREKTVPPSSVEALAGILQLQAERDFATDSKDLALDYAGEPDAAKGRTVLMVATLQRRLGQITEAAESAGLRVAAVTSSAMVLSDAARTTDGRGLTLSLKAGGAELTVQTGDQFQLLRHLPVAEPPADNGAAAAWVASLASEVRRAISALPEGGEASQPYLMVWDGTDHGPEAVESLGANLGISTCVGDARSVLGFTSLPDGSQKYGARLGQAAALSLAGVDPRRLPIDFLHSRLAVKRKSVFGPRVIAATVVGLAFLGASAYLGSDWYFGQREISEMKARLADMKGDISAAKDLVTKYNNIRPWYDKRPAILGCMNEIWAAFPRRGGIWATNLTINEPNAATPTETGFQGLLQGKAQDERIVQETMDTLMRSHNFKNVTRLYIREAARGSREVAFALRFGYSPTE